MYYLGPPSTPPALDLPAGTSARVAWLRSSCEVSKASVGELTNCFSRVDRETGSTRWPRSLQKNNGKSSLFVRSHPKPMTRRTQGTNRTRRVQTCLTGALSTDFTSFTLPMRFQSYTGDSENSKTQTSASTPG